MEAGELVLSLHCVGLSDILKVSWRDDILTFGWLSQKNHVEIVAVTH